MERRIASLPPYAALAIFLVPTLLLLPVKLLALWLISRSWVVLGHTGHRGGQTGGDGRGGTPLHADPTRAD